MHPIVGYWEKKEHALGYQQACAMDRLGIVSTEMSVPNLQAYKVFGDDMTLTSIQHRAWELDDLDGRDSVQHPEWQALYMQFKSSHVLGTVPYRWESRTREYSHAQLLAVQIDAVDIIVLDGPLLHDGGIGAEEKAAAVKAHLQLTSSLGLEDQTSGLLMHELGRRGKAALVRETEDEWELLLPHSLLPQLTFSERVIARWRKHEEHCATSHWCDVSLTEQAGVEAWEPWDDCAPPPCPCIPDLDLDMCLSAAHLEKSTCLVAFFSSILPVV